MNWDLATDLLFDMAKYCPICAGELEVKERTIGDVRRQKIIVLKSCPNGHGEVDVAGRDSRGPRLEFDPAEEMWDGVAK
jgi:hypothetical protein